MGVTINTFDIRTLTRTANGHEESEESDGHADGFEASVVDAHDFFDRVVHEYNEGPGSDSLDADIGLARSIIPAGTGGLS